MNAVVDRQFEAARLIKMLYTYLLPAARMFLFLLLSFFFACVGQYNKPLQPSLAS